VVDTFAQQKTSLNSLNQPGPNTNLNTPEYYQGQRDAMGGGFGTPPVPGTYDNTYRDPFSAGYIPPPPITAAPQDNSFSLAAQPPTLAGGAPDPGAIRRRLMGSIPGATDAAGLPYNAAFDTGVQNLYSTEMNKLATYDQQQGDIQSQYEKNRDYQLQHQDLDMKNLMDRMAFQGILNSGITTDQRALLGQRYGQNIDRLAAAQAASLRNLATQRLAAQSEYQTKLGDLETGYANNVAKWLQDQATQEAARQQQQAQDQANAELLAQLQQAQQASYAQQQAVLDQISGQAALPVLPASNSAGPIDWAAVAAAVAAGMNLPVGYGGSLQ
jgi:hypothetical protein